MSRRVARIETVTYAERARAAPCAFHALADITPTPARAVVWEGGCVECGETIIYHSTTLSGRELALRREVYAAGYTPARLTADRRGLAVLAWIHRQPPTEKPEPLPPGAYARALADEHGRRMLEKWTAHWQTLSNELLEAAGDMLEGRVTDAELKAIIWPEPAKARRGK